MPTVQKRPVIIRRGASPDTCALQSTDMLVPDSRVTFGSRFHDEMFGYISNVALIGPRSAIR